MRNFREIATGSRVINIRIKEQTRELVKGTLVADAGECAIVEWDGDLNPVTEPWADIA
ncbi:hypothetical protein [Gordonia sp. (in: high G+C Gram-positive bacteria)]|jgi:hypothetical protein|nr:hypothetical protein [Gordonia sp. (in: high G+C Gram-positive bacteria)]HMS75616.1 hypothetical protein [Gordonia sp. (in: high G+C Gram-positive bacteria)]HQV20351.1 hypothetical protein [Gordonia sp. (in: high G+C Gram-positive bacteria)]